LNIDKNKEFFMSYYSWSNIIINQTDILAESLDRENYFNLHVSIIPQLHDRYFIYAIAGRDNRDDDYEEGYIALPKSSLLRIIANRAKQQQNPQESYHTIQNTLIQENENISAQQKTTILVMMYELSKRF
jgi:hypothetical protein